MSSREDKALDRKAATKKKLTDSAVKLFSENWYEGISVAEICRNAGLSNGVYYRYYRSKEDLIREILDSFLDTIQQRLSGVAGDTPYERLCHFYSLVEYSNRVDVPYISIFREGEFRYPEYEDRLRMIYRQVLAAVFGRTVSLAEYLYAVGSLRFMIRRPFRISEGFSGTDYCDMVFNGIFSTGQQWHRHSLDADLPPAVDDPESADTRTKLILAGKDLISEKGFQKVNIYEITSKAGFAVGTFYIHFAGKEEFFAEVVKYISRNLREYISVHLDKGLNRIDSELKGWMLFLKYFETHTRNYQIVREAEFVVKTAAQSYYDSFQDGYVKNLAGIRDLSATAAANFLIGIAHHLGIEYFFSKNIVDPAAIVSELAELLRKGINLPEG